MPTDGGMVAHVLDVHEWACFVVSVSDKCTTLGEWMTTWSKINSERLDHDCYLVQVIQ
jgi:hypothetical protein